jgi:serine/threonine protein kinase/tetratricopeptide (TPR) repeat protein
MATVYLAEDLKHARQVAVKVLRPELVTSGAEAARFLREIRIAANLSHPQIVPVHDSGERDGFLYFVMPYIGGESLRQRLAREGRLPVPEALTIARSVALALAYAHRQNVIHRDVKPENILLHEGQAVVADFGIARAITAAAADDLTARGLTVGTPAYMSPEQAAAERELDGRSDLYSLACVVYETLTGEPPFAGGSAQRTLSRHLVEPPAPLRQRRPTVPEQVERAVLRALAKEPENRFAGTAEFAAALTAPTAEYPAAHRAERFVAVLPFVNASPDPENEYLSDGLTDELINALANIPGLRVASRTSVFALKGRKDSLRVLGSELGASVVLEGTVRRAESRVRITTQLTDVHDGRLLWSERYDRRMDDIFDLQEEMARTIVGTLRATFLGDLGDPVSRRYTDNLRAWQLYLKGRFAWNKRTREGIAEAVQYFEDAAREDPGYALAYSGLADCYALEVDYRGAPVAEGMRRAREEARKALALDEGLAEAHTSLAWVLFIHDWDWEGAGTHFLRAIELNPRYATARQWYGWLLIAMGRTDEAITQGRIALELDPASVSISRSLGWLLYVAQRTGEAIDQLQRALAMNPVSEETQWVLGLAFIQAGRYQEAEIALREADAGARGANHHAFAALGHLAVLQGRREEAERALATLTELARTRYVSPVDLARLHIVLGDTDGTFHWLEQAYAERRGWMTYLNVEPLLEPIRSDPRFADLVRRLKLD